MDGGGLVFIGGVPIPVGPWGELSEAMRARRDVLIGLALEQLASTVGDPAGGAKIRIASLELVQARVVEMIRPLRDGLGRSTL